MMLMIIMMLMLIVMLMFVMMIIIMMMFMMEKREVTDSTFNMLMLSTFVATLYPSASLTARSSIDGAMELSLLIASRSFCFNLLIVAIFNSLSPYKSVSINT